MTQRQMDAPQPLPGCTLGHPVRYMLDARCAKAGGGHFIECRCCSTRKHPSFAFALQDWRRLHRTRVDCPLVKANPQRSLFGGTAYGASFELGAKYLNPGANCCQYQMTFDVIRFRLFSGPGGSDGN